MNWLTREQVKEEVVKPALKRVADFDESKNWDGFDFSNFHGFHKWVFINEVSFLMNMKGYDIFLSVAKLDGRTIDQFIDYVVEKQRISLNPPRSVVLS